MSIKLGYRQMWKRVLAILEIPQPEDAQIFRRIRVMEVDLMMPLKAVAFLLLTRSVYFPVWTRALGEDVLHASEETGRSILWLYLLFSAVLAVMMFLSQRLPVRGIQWIAVATSFLDAIFLGVIALVTGGYDSPVFWLFVGLIVRNAVSVPQAWKQHALNLLACIMYAFSAIQGSAIAENLTESSQKIVHPTAPEDFVTLDKSSQKVRRPAAKDVITLNESSQKVLRMTAPEDVISEPFLARLVILCFTAVLCHAVQLMIERYRLANEESREFATRESQLHSAGRLAARIAHQIKNPLAIINNTAFSLRRGLTDIRPEVVKQIEIIQEEVERADQIITQLMGYAQLSEGRVEKLNIIEELDRAIFEVFPPAMETGIVVTRKYDGDFPPLLMHRGHLSEIITNLLQNARDELKGFGHIHVSARCRSDQSIEICVHDDGPGVPPEKREQIFEAYYTTKQRGTGLGLAIVKQNLELYGGTIQVESGLGKGAKFVVLFPAKALMKLGK